MLESRKRPAQDFIENPLPPASPLAAKWNAWTSSHESRFGKGYRTLDAPRWTSRKTARMPGGPLGVAVWFGSKAVTQNLLRGQARLPIRTFGSVATGALPRHAPVRTPKSIGGCLGMQVPEMGRPTST
jgi:hypothetical protein